MSLLFKLGNFLLINLSFYFKILHPLISTLNFSYHCYNSILLLLRLFFYINLDTTLYILALTFLKTEVLYIVYELL